MSYEEMIKEYKPEFPGEVVVCNRKDGFECYIWENDQWILLQSKKKDNVNLYSLNKSAVVKLPDLKVDETIYSKMIDKMCEWHDDEYFMLLCRDMNYYTILHKSNIWATLKVCDELGTTVIDCLSNVGSIKSIEYVDKNIEIWVVKDNEAFCFYLFPYSLGVVEFHG